ncbi:hypothetical protein [Brevundimonas sp.]|uniref:hypothetical protein n=1 Tax=Brevundimonas sp. TaxID=1871086 RepID=UPI003D105A5A
MRLSVCLGVVAVATVAASGAAAQETQTYGYDVHGRLIEVGRSTGGANQSTAYQFDGADNRVQRNTTSASARSALQPSRTREAAPATGSAAQTVSGEDDVSSQRAETSDTSERSTPLRGDR